MGNASLLFPVISRDLDLMTLYSPLNNDIRPHPPLVPPKEQEGSGKRERRLSRAVWYWLYPWRMSVWSVYGNVSVVKEIDSLYRTPLEITRCEKMEQWYTFRTEFDDNNPALTYDALYLMMILKGVDPENWAVQHEKHMITP